MLKRMLWIIISNGTKTQLFRKLPGFVLVLKVGCVLHYSMVSTSPRLVSHELKKKRPYSFKRLILTMLVTNTTTFPSALPSKPSFTILCWTSIKINSPMFFTYVSNSLLNWYYLLRIESLIHSTSLLKPTIPTIPLTLKTSKDTEFKLYPNIIYSHLYALNFRKHKEPTTPSLQKLKFAPKRTLRDWSYVYSEKLGFDKVLHEDESIATWYKKLGRHTLSVSLCFFIL